MWLSIVIPIGVPSLLVLIPIFLNWSFEDAVFIFLLVLGFLAFSYYLVMSEEGDY